VLLKKRVILVTDGDYFAKQAVEAAARNIGGCVITESAGNPTPLSPESAIRLIMEAEGDPVIVMVDDSGHIGMGPGEELMLKIINHPDIDVLGVVAVATNTEKGERIEVTQSVTRDGKVIDRGVNKYGTPVASRVVTGDTLSILKQMSVPVIIGLGDPGKMSYLDDAAKGAPLTTKALKEILEAQKERPQ